jgi:hypothetical protein
MLMNVSNDTMPPHGVDTPLLAAKSTTAGSTLCQMTTVWLGYKKRVRQFTCCPSSMQLRVALQAAAC